MSVLCRKRLLLLFDFVVFSYSYVILIVLIKIKMVDEVIEKKLLVVNCKVGIIVIGDEILKGYMKDINFYFLLKKLWLLGIKVGKILFFLDDVDEIVYEVKLFFLCFFFVIIIGGIGFIYDDVIMVGIVKVFDEDFVFNEELIKLFLSVLDCDLKLNFDF